jgi:hypothetical protein
VTKTLRRVKYHDGTSITKFVIEKGVIEENHKSVKTLKWEF